MNLYLAKEDEREGFGGGGGGEGFEMKELLFFLAKP
jgi:hypothetical protein